ncbi:hypothetical protein LG329_00960 [Virgibacillus necropolis]|uniref:hypothetical protein n=1 Tax=Virgibacillus necropolis TaxID=163877 RepID=UPI00384CD5E4
MSPEPNWQPIRHLPMIAKMIDGQLEHAQEQYLNLLEARSTPHVLDDDTVHSVIQSYTEQLESVPIYEKQLERWQTEATPDQQREIQLLQKQVRKWKQVITDILDLADELKEGTSEKVMSKSDLELGIQSFKKTDR